MATITEKPLDDIILLSIDTISSNGTPAGTGAADSTIPSFDGGQPIGLANGTRAVDASDPGASASPPRAHGAAEPALSTRLARDSGAPAGKLTSNPAPHGGGANAVVALTEGHAAPGAATAEPAENGTFTPMVLAPGINTQTSLGSAAPPITPAAPAAVTVNAPVTLHSAPLSLTLAPAATSAVPAYSHIVVVIEENHNYDEIIGNTAEAPYINSLSAGGALLTNYDAITHPSQPNYFALYAGSTFGTSDDNPHPEPDPTLATILQGAGKTFVGYVDQSNSDMNHNPWESFPEGTSVQTDFGPGTSYADFPSLFPSGDYAALPTVSFVIPGLDNDMHDGTILQGDTWLQANLGAYATWAQSNNSLLIVTWDENSGSEPSNQVATILYGADVVTGTYNTAYNHYNLLSTLLAGYGLTGPNNAATAAPIAVFGPSPPCYRAGTRVLTDHGDVAVENLAVGDRIVSAFGGTVPVVWLGHRRVDCRRHPKPHDVWPVRVAAGAFGPGLPCRDLWLSPDHAVFVDGVLIPIRYLLNDATICRQPVHEVTYWHIELPVHDVLFAEGLPAESYLDTGNRGAFANAAAAVLHPDFALRVWEAEACARLVCGGGERAAVRRRLHERALSLGHVATPDAALRLEVDGHAIPSVLEGRTYRFRLPRTASRGRLVSRGTVPAFIYPDSDDHRRLGVAVSRIVLDGRAIALADPRLGAGWQAVESDGPGGAWRWTNGNAALDVAGVGALEIEVALTARYWVADRQTHVLAA